MHTLFPKAHPKASCTCQLLSSRDTCSESLILVPKLRRVWTLNCLLIFESRSKGPEPGSPLDLKINRTEKHRGVPSHEALRTFFPYREIIPRDQLIFLIASSKVEDVLCFLQRSRMLPIFDSLLTITANYTRNGCCSRVFAHFDHAKAGELLVTPAMHAQGFA